MYKFITAENHGSLGILTLNRPHALNALVPSMTMEAITVLNEWENDRQIKTVALCSITPRAFCSGGDIREIRNKIIGGDSEDASRVFCTNYNFIRKIHQYKKPIITFLDGIVMGGGIGIGCFSTYRIATDQTIFAMPEVHIGLTPDAGGSWLLSRIKGYLGLRYALTGKEILCKEAISLGFADYVLNHSQINDLKNALKTTSAEQAISDITNRKHLYKLPKNMAVAIDRVYSSGEIIDIMNALEHEPEDWAQTDLSEIKRACPFSLKVTLRAWELMRHIPSLGKGLKQDLILVSALITRDDFLEGVRARLIDKDQTPHWKPDNVADVEDIDLSDIFSQLSSKTVRSSN